MVWLRYAFQAIIALANAVPAIIDLLGKAWSAFQEWMKRREEQKRADDLAKALDRATGPEKDTRDLERSFDPNRSYPRSGDNTDGSVK